MEAMLQQYVNNLSAGDQTTLIATLVAAIGLFFVIKMFAGMLKALVIMGVLLVGAALLFPDAQLMEKVGEGAQTALEKGKAFTENLGESGKEAVDTDVIQQLQEQVKKAME